MSSTSQWPAALAAGLSTGLLAGVGWLVRRWVNSLEKKIDRLETRTGEQFSDTQAIVLELDAKIDDTREGMARIEGALGLPPRLSRRRKRDR